MDSAVEIEDDVEFLFHLAAAEAQARALSSNKRLKLSSFEKEGAYTAALRGSNSLLWKQQQQSGFKYMENGRVKVVVDQSEADGGGGGNGCFKCGKLGHWARDCDEVGNGGGSESLIPQKKCPCGLGDCLVLTANTEKNLGRKFYKCSHREESGGCGFFEWCDNASGTYSTTSGSQSLASNALFPDLPCSCGAGNCLILTAKTGNNVGRQFYRCPGNQGSSCGFFKWCNDDNVVAPVLPVNASKSSNITNETIKRNFGLRTGSSCFKCGNEGHWAKDCPTPSVSSAGSGEKFALSGTCYKCGQPGHWARDCSN